MSDKDKEDLLGYDFEGWPVFRLSWKEILEMLGFERVDGKYVIDESNEILEKYPLCLEDDGMGYGVNGKYVTSVNDRGYLFIEEKQEIKEE